MAGIGERIPTPDRWLLPAVFSCLISRPFKPSRQCVTYCCRLLDSHEFIHKAFRGKAGGDKDEFVPVLVESGPVDIPWGQRLFRKAQVKCLDSLPQRSSDRLTRYRDTGNFVSHVTGTHRW